MKRTVALLLAFVMVAGGCSVKGEDKPEPIPAVSTALNIQLGTEPDVLDPAFAVAPAEQSYLVHLYEGLTTLSNSLEATPGVAASWTTETSDTGLVTYTFKLDPAAKWSDGEPVKAADFIYAWSRLLAPATDSPNAYKLYPIRGAQAYHTGSFKPEKTEEDESGASSGSSSSASSKSASSTSSSASSESAGSGAADEQPTGDDLAADLTADTGLGLRVGEAGELIVELEGNYPDFLLRVADPVWVPLRQSVVEKNPEYWSYDAKTAVSNGPYVLSKWERFQNITMDRNKNYRNVAAVKAPKLNFVLRDNSEQLLAALQDGSIQLATTLPQLEVEKLRDQLQKNVVLGSYSLLFNTKTVTSTELRSALSLALDRTALTQAMRDNSAPATALIPAGSVADGVDVRKKGGDLVKTAADVAAAKKLVEKQKLTGKLQYLVVDQPAQLRIAEQVVAAWAAIGVETELVPVKYDEYVARREDGKFDVTHLSIFSDNLFPSAFLDSWVSDSPVNFAQYNSNSYDGLIDQSYGRPPRAPAADETAEGDKAEGDKTDTAKTDTAKTDTAKTDDKAEGETEPTQLSAIEAIVAAEKLLLQEVVLAPISWYTNSYLTCDSGLTGYKSYPTGYMYFGEAEYKAPAAK